MIKHTIYTLITIFTFFTLFSCASQSQIFLANKHDVNRNSIKIISEEQSEVAYSPIFDLEDVLHTSRNLNKNNYDSVYNAYHAISDKETCKSNCISYNVKYKIKKDTIMQRVYFINKPTFTVTHDNDAIEAMHSLIKLNFNRFQRKNNQF